MSAHLDQLIAGAMLTQENINERDDTHNQWVVRSAQDRAHISKLEGLLRSSLTCVEVLKDLVEGDRVLKKLLPGLPGIEKKIKEVIK